MIFDSNIDSIKSETLSVDDTTYIPELKIFPVIKTLKLLSLIRLIYTYASSYFSLHLSIIILYTSLIFLFLTLTVPTTGIKISPLGETINSRFIILLLAIILNK